MKTHTLLVLILVLALLAPTAAATPLAGPCVAGATYDPACDVDQDGDVDIFDIQKTAGHWNQAGTFVSDNNHNHLGQTWTGANNPLRIEGAFGAPDYAPLIIRNTGGMGLDIDTFNTGVLVRSNDTGVGVVSAGGRGVSIESAGLDGVHVLSANYDGMNVDYVDDDGVDVYSAADDGFVICRAGSSTSCILDGANHNGLEVGLAQDYGARVLQAGRSSFRSDASGTNGVYIYDAGDSGIWIRAATNWAGYFAGDINVTGNCTGCRLAQMAINAGGVTLQPGDVVAAAGVASSPFAGSDLLLRVRRATPGSPLIGVVSGRATVFTSQEDGSTTLVPQPGEPAAAGEYVSVVIYGPMQVAAANEVKLGDRVTVADSRGVRTLSTFQVTRTDGGIAAVVEAAPVLGMALEDARDGQVWVLVNP